MGPDRTSCTSARSRGGRGRPPGLFSVWPAKAGTISPGRLSGRRSRTTRWAARSRVVQPSHSVSAVGSDGHAAVAQVVTFASSQGGHAFEATRRPSTCPSTVSGDGGDQAAVRGWGGGSEPFDRRR